jgi:hypothetical protein
LAVEVQQVPMLQLLERMAQIASFLPGPRLEAVAVHHLVMLLKTVAQAVVLSLPTIAEELEFQGKALKAET